MFPESRCISRIIVQLDSHRLQVNPRIFLSQLNRLYDQNDDTQQFCMLLNFNTSIFQNSMPKHDSQYLMTTTKKFHQRSLKV